jgi:hypothetical protein
MKKRLKKRTWQFLSLMLLLLLLASPAWAQGGDFKEDFEDSELDGWERSPDVIIVDGALRISAGGFAFKMGDWEDFTLTLRVKTSGPGDVNLHYYAREESRYQIHILPEEIILERRSSVP